VSLTASDADPDLRKRLGQVFTGAPLARLLAALARAAQASTIIDPMVGSGDMLKACRRIAPDALLAGIELDPAALDACRQTLGSEAVLIRGSAFHNASWHQLPAAWDLVITNPPYVRYQTGRHALSTPDISIPNANEIRQTLIAHLSGLPHLTPREREGFIRCAASYSGLADLAVPSWLLCAAHVAPGGRLAMVVADTWLSRDYAAPVLYALRRFFEIEHVVEDAEAAWFADVMVRTTLVVARRVPDKGTALDEGHHLRTVIRAAAASPASLVGSAVTSRDPETSFAAWLDDVPENGGSATGVVVGRSDEGDLRAALSAASVRLPWLTGVAHLTTPAVPEVVRRSTGTVPARIVNLADLGWAVGQGLRTGANDFFYVTKAPEGGWTSPLLPGEVLDLPGAATRAAVRNQADLVRGRRVVAAPASAVLCLDDFALPEDTNGSSSSFRQIHGDLARLVRAAAAHGYQRGGQIVRLPDLTAVRPNMRFDRKTGTPTRFWYHLPPLAVRHLPQLYLPRVCGGRPLPYANPGSELVIDANFSTLWSGADGLPEMAMLALLSSSWAWSCLEASATVLGGGALKVEAAHLRRLPLPMIDGDTAVRLCALGLQLMDGKDVANQIDWTVSDALALPPGSPEELAVLATRLLSRRLGA
jgi:hypothetical protein